MFIFVCDDAKLRYICDYEFLRPPKGMLFYFAAVHFSDFFPVDIYSQSLLSGLQRSKVSVLRKF